MERTKLVLGRGEVYFNPFAPGTLQGQGEIYIGNTPEFTTSRELQSQQVMDSFDGQKVPIEGAVIRETHSARFTTDHMDEANLSLWYGGETTELSQTRQDGVSESFVVRRGRYYQLGVTSSRPVGVRGVEDVVVSIDGVGVDGPLNIAVDKTLGRFQVLADAPDIADGDTVLVTYQQRDVTSVVTLSQKKELYGSLRFIARNQVGPQRNYFFPVVKLTPAGEIDHKANDWQRMSFDVEAQRRSPATEYVYVDEITVLGKTVFEYAIEELSGITIEEFPYWEDRLNTITNVRIPSRDYHL